MNAKIRALLGEELRVGGTIAATCTGAGLFALATFYLDSLRITERNLWHHVDVLALTATLAVPMVLALLLTLSTANSGHLKPGFSRRIFELPVSTRIAVLVPLLTRLAGVLAVAIIMRAACWTMFGDGPGSRVVIALACLYLFIQVLDWLRPVAPLLVPILIFAALGALFGFIGGLSDWAAALAAGDGITPGLLVAFAVAVALTGTLSVASVGATRCGERWSLFSLASLDRILSLGTRERRKPFSSPLAAQAWFELRGSPLSLSIMAGMVYLLINLGRWFVLYSLSREHREALSVSALLDPYWLFEKLPFYALVLASFAWALRLFWREWVGGGRPAIFATRQPITKARMAQARLIAAAVNLAVALVIVAVVYAVSFLFAEDALFARLLMQARSHGYTNIREICGILIGPSIIAGIAAWAVLGATNRTGIWLLVPEGAAAVLLLTRVMIDREVRGTLLDTWSPSVFWLALVLPQLWLVASMAVAWWSGRMRWRSLAVCLLLWAAITLGVFPFLAPHSTYGAAMAVAVSLALGALAVLPYSVMTLDFSRLGLREPVSHENSRQHARGQRRRMSLGHAVGLLALVGAVAVFVWIRWPAEPVYKAVLRAEGLPTNPTELDAWYAEVPKAENIAYLYLNAYAKKEELERHWWHCVTKVDPLPPGVTWENIGLYSRLHLLGLERQSLDRRDLIPFDMWQWSKRYWDDVGAEVCRDLHAAAHSGCTGSRYPMRRWGPTYLSSIRWLGRQLGLEVWIASVERRPDAAVEAVLDMLPIADSLEKEPRFGSQLCLGHIYKSVIEILEVAMNRTVLPETALVYLQERLSSALPLTCQTPLIERGIVGSQAWLPAVAEDRLAELVWDLYSSETLGQVTAICAIAPFLHLAGRAACERSVIADWCSSLREVARDGPSQKLDDFVHAAEQSWTRRMYRHAPTATLTLKGIGYNYIYEWHVRVLLDKARTGIAVERFRLAHGRLPERLDELVPEFIERIPDDPWNRGEPLSYRVRQNGDFVVYSYGLNREDDFDEEETYYSTKWSSSSGDDTFTVAPPEIRDRPQVAPEVPLDAEDDDDA
ncbi:MAG TPA: hypothetical protein PLO37_20640 [Candidatus Hydrogenedentes bacterium]|nr:hypothetical protein [Candidatus Hydrogenedentota bacterium]